MNQNEHDWIIELMDTAEKDLTPKQIKIIQAAIEIFSEKGFAAASTNEIAKRAGVAEGTIFRHYKTKKDLLISIVLPVISKLAVPLLAEKFVKEVFQNGDYEDLEGLIRKLMKSRFEFMKKNAPLIKIVLQEMAYHTEIQENFKEVFIEKVYPNFVKAVEHLREKEKLADFPAETILRLTISSIIGLLITRFMIMPDYPWDDEKEINYTIQFIRNGLKGV